MAGRLEHLSILPDAACAASEECRQESRVRNAESDARQRRLGPGCLRQCHEIGGGAGAASVDRPVSISDRLSERPKPLDHLPGRLASDRRGVRYDGEICGERVYFFLAIKLKLRSVFFRGHKKWSGKSAAPFNNALIRIKSSFTEQLGYDPAVRRHHRQYLLRRSC